MEMRLHLQKARDEMRLIDASRSLAANVQLLQRNDIGTRLGDDIGDPVRIDPPVGTDAAMHVVGQDSDRSAALQR